MPVGVFRTTSILTNIAKPPKYEAAVAHHYPDPCVYLFFPVISLDLYKSLYKLKHKL